MDISNDTFKQNKVLTGLVGRAAYCKDRGVVLERIATKEWRLGRKLFARRKGSSQDYVTTVICGISSCISR